jgi:hypothetical protein
MKFKKLFCAQRKRISAVVCLISLFFLHLYLKSNNSLTQSRKSNPKLIHEKHLQGLYDAEGIKNSPLIFVGGYARSGTTLMRAILGAHHSVSCGPETKIIPDLLKFHLAYTSNEANLEELDHAGLDKTKLNNALRIYLFSLMNEHVRPAERLCAKDPETLHFMNFLAELFPNSKFIAMVRDPRAVGKLNNHFVCTYNL